MTKAVLVRKGDHAVVGAVMDTARTQWIVDPDTKRKLASPAAVGWENDDYRLCALREFSAPQGKAVSGARTRVFDAGSGIVVERVEVADVPRPSAPPTDAEKLERAVGLSIAQIKAILENGDAAR
jgi:hypothetical protein